MVQRRLIQLELAARQLADEDDPSVSKRLDDVKSEMETCKQQLADLREQWEAEKLGVTDVQNVRQQLEQAELQFRQLDSDIKTRQSTGQAVGEEDYRRLYELDTRRKELEKQIELAEKSEVNESEDSRKRLLSEFVTAEEVAEVVSHWTGVPIASMLESEKAKLLVMEERLHQRVIGQDEAVSAVSNAVRRSRSGLQDPNRPIGSFLFLGPTGVGKTELCKALAQIMFDDETAMIRIDMSEFMEKHSVSRLIGAPPGYVGFEQGGKLTEAVRRRPYSVILLDEIEKAHHDVYNILLQILDDGRLTDNHGNTVDFTNTIIAMTSNIGSQMIQRITSEGGTDEDVRDAVDETVKAKFAPELINRIDEKIVFKPLGRDQVRQIVDLQIELLAQRLVEKELKLEVRDVARQAIANLGYDPHYGARPLKRVIQDQLANPLATQLLRSDFKTGDTITVDYQGERFVFNKRSNCLNN